MTVEQFICTASRAGIWLILMAATAAMVVDAVGLSFPVLMLMAATFLAVAVALKERPELSAD